MYDRTNTTPQTELTDILTRLLRLEEVMVGRKLSGAPHNVFDPEDVGLSEEDAAKILGVTVPTLRTWRSLGRGPDYRRPGKFIEYTPRAIKAYQAASNRKPEPASVRRQRRALGK